MILDALVEGSSVNATARMCRVNKLTVLRLLADVGRLCRDFHDITVRGLHSQRVQVDEVWSYVGCKERAKARGAEGHGDAWVWIALDADSKLIVSYIVGERDASYGRGFDLPPIHVPAAVRVGSSSLGRASGVQSVGNGAQLARPHEAAYLAGV